MKSGIKIKLENTYKTEIGMAMLPSSSIYTHISAYLQPVSPNSTKATHKLNKAIKQALFNTGYTWYLVTTDIPQTLNSSIGGWAFIGIEITTQINPKIKKATDANRTKIMFEGQKIYDIIMAVLDKNEDFIFQPQKKV